jgi:hypothetical protein
MTGYEWGVKTIIQRTESAMIKIKEADFNKISQDYRGTWEGKRSVFAGCIMNNGGTRYALEGIDFEIVPMPQPYKRRSRRYN